MLDLIFGNSTQQLISKIITIVAILVAVYLFLYFFSNFKPVQSLFYGVIFVVLIVSGIMSFGNLNIYYSSKGGVFGEITSIFEKNQVEIIEEETEINFNFSNVVLMKNANGKYSASITSDKILKLDTNENYFIYVNDEPCTTVICEERDIYATYSYTFMNREAGEYKVLADDTMTFYFALYDNYSYLYIEVENGEETASLWNAYFTKNNFKARITKVSSDFYTQASYKTIRFFSKDYKEIKRVQIKENSDYILPSLEYDGFTYNYWQDANDNIIFKVVNITENIDLYGLEYISVDLNYATLDANTDTTWTGDLSSEIPTKTYNTSFLIESDILSDCLQNKNFSTIEINLNFSSFTELIDGEYTSVGNVSFASGQILTIKITSDGKVSCSGQFKSVIFQDNTRYSTDIDNTLKFDNGYSLENNILTIDGTFTIENLLQLYQETYPDETFTYNIFTGFEIDGLESIKIFR